MARWAKLEEQKTALPAPPSSAHIRNASGRSIKRAGQAYTFQFDQTQKRLRAKYGITR
jgi:hypothetical protein